MIIYVNVNADPEQIVSVLRRELGPELCRRVGRALVEERYVLIDMPTAAEDQRIGGSR
jgi:hypothetical protein